MNTKWKPETGGNACQPNDKGVQKYWVVDRVAAEVFFNTGRAVDENWADFAYGRRLVRVLQFELFEPVEQLREPQHKSVITEKNHKIGQDFSDCLKCHFSISFSEGVRHSKIIKKSNPLFYITLMSAQTELSRSALCISNEEVGIIPLFATRFHQRVSWNLFEILWFWCSLHLL